MERYFAHASTSAGSSALPVSGSAGQPASSGELSSITTQQPGSSSAEQPDSTGGPASSAVEQRISILLDVERWLAADRVASSGINTQRIKQAVAVLC